MVLTPREMADQIVAWLKGQPGKTFGYDAICQEIRSRWPRLPQRDTDFVFRKVIYIMAGIS